jgi:hypothetical protein
MNWAHIHLSLNSNRAGDSRGSFYRRACDTAFGLPPVRGENWMGVMFAVGFFLALGLGINSVWSLLRSGLD